MEQAGTSPAAETEAAFGAPPRGLASRWRAEIEAFERERRSYAERADKITKRYRNEHGREERRFALLWANIEVLTPTVYARDPQPRVFRRFRDRDPVGRVAARLLERSLSCQIEKGGDFGLAARAAVQDYLLVGQGVGWVFYEPSEAGERAVLQQVHWRDFGFTAGARTWAEVSAVWRAAYMTRDALIERFGDVAKAVPLDRAPAETSSGTNEAKADVIGKATVYEVWDATRREVVWLHRSVPEPLDVRPYPLRMRGRFPCPRPMFGTMTTGSTVPVPDFVYYQDQALELDDLTARIAALSKALKLVGFVPGETQADIQKGLDSAQEVALVPVSSWALGQGRPMDDAIAWLPVREVAETLARLLELREAVKRDAYEVTGLSDILRGQTAASETATAQQIKAQWGSIRVRDRQQEVARWCRDAIEIMADVVCGHFEPETIFAEANAEALPESEAQYLGDALALLKGPDALRAYRVDVETDSTIAADEVAERQAATELLTGVSGFLSGTMPIVQGVAMQAPHAVGAMAEMVGGLLTMAVRRFRGGEEAEELVERAMQALSQPAPAQGVPQGPSPEEMAMQAEAQRAQMDAQAKAAEMQSRAQIEAGKAEVQMRVKEMEIAAEDRRHQAELAVRLQIAEMQAAQKAADSERAAAERAETRAPTVALSLGQETERAVGEALAPLAQAAAQVTQAVAVSSEAAQATTQAAAQMAQATQAIAEAARLMAAPVEIVRGPDGRAAGTRRVIQ
ncbi:MAG: hypothetical protein ACK52I_12215 [Pseudomonadota bacterium]